MRPRDALVAAARLVGGLALLVGVPAALVVGVGWPLPREMPSLDAIREALSREGVSVEVMAKTLAVIVWVAWAQLAVALVLELGAAVKGHQAARAPLLPGVQVLAGQIVAAAALLVSLLGPLRATVTDTDQPIEVVRLELVAGPQAPALPAGPTQTSAVGKQGGDAVADGDAGDYVVQRGDSYWAIAVRTLGDGMRWREIRDPNVGRRMPDGHTIGPDDTLLRPGWRITLPTEVPLSGAATSAPASASDVVDDAYVVQAGDHFWSIAVDHLASELGRQPTDSEIVPYWRSLIDANRDRISSRDPDLIYPGEHVVIPNASGETRDHAHSEPPASTAAETADDAPSVAGATEGEAGDGQGIERSSASAVEAGDGGEPTDVVEETPPQPREEDALAPPTEHTPPTTAPSPPSTTPASSAPTTAVGSEAAADADASEDEGTPLRGPLLGIGGVALAVALLRAHRRQRARRAAALPLDVMPPPPPPQTRQLAGEIVATADEPNVDRLDAALASLAEGLRPRGGQPCPQPKLVQLDASGRVEVLLDAATVNRRRLLDRPWPAPPWRPDASGLIWVLDADVEVEADAGGVSPLPALVTVGVGELTILVDLEAHGVVSLSGDATACQGLARSMVAELSSRGEGTVLVEVVGRDLLGGGVGLEGVCVVEDWGEVDPSVVGRRRTPLDAGRWPHAFAARASGRGFGGLTPGVWVGAPSDHPRYRDVLASVAQRPGAGTALVVVGGTADVGLEIALADGRFHIPELGLSGAAQMLASETVEGIAELLAEEPQGEAQRLPFPLQSPAGDGASATVSAAAALSETVGNGGYADPSVDVLVRVCGDIHVQHAAATLTPAEAAVVTYVALNGPTDVNQVRDAVWGGRRVDHKTVSNVIAKARHHLGEAIQHTGDGRLCPGPGLMSDVELLRRRVEHARHLSDPTERAATLRDGLEWVTGPVCSYPTSGDRARRWTWVETDHWISHVAAVVGTASSEAARAYLELGDVDAAVWAARTGLHAAGPREQLVLLLVEAYEAGGDEAAARAALNEHLRFLEESGGTEDYSPELAAALQRLLPVGERTAG